MRTKTTKQQLATAKKRPRRTTMIEATAFVVLMLCLLAAATDAAPKQQSSPSLQARDRKRHFLPVSHRRLEEDGLDDEDKPPKGDSSDDDDDSYRYCQTRPPTRCDRLLLRNTYEIYVTRQLSLIANNETIDDSPIDINVYFHKAINESMPAVPLKSETIDLFMRRQAKAFSGTKFRFHYVNQSLSINNDWHTCGENKGKEWKEATHVGGPKDLNVWLCDVRLNNKVFLGQGRYPNIAERHPEEDGLTIMNPEFTVDDPKVENPFEIYWQLPHQTGHWLGLLHTFVGGCHRTVVKNPSPTFLARGDGVTDTPPQAKNSFHQRGTRRCFQKSPRTPDTCKDNAGRDDVFNYMNVLPWRCWGRFGHFTNEQVVRMEAMYREYREFGRRKDVVNFTPLRDDIIDACLDDAIEKCDPCDIKCLLKFGEDAFALIQVGASREIFVSPS